MAALGSDGGAIGAGGTGLVAQDSIISLAAGGVISGGLDGSGARTGLALDLSGSNSLYLVPGGTLLGGVKTSGALTVVITRLSAT